MPLKSLITSILNLPIAVEIKLIIAPVQHAVVFVVLADESVDVEQ